MDMRQLATFRLLARTLSFTRTAAALNYVQSTVTTQIQALEGELGVQLFDRLGKRVALTNAGYRLLDYANKILTLADEAQCAVADQDEPAGLLTVSAPVALHLSFTDHSAQIPLVLSPSTFAVSPRTCAELRRLLADGTIDVMYVMDAPLRSTDLMIKSLAEEDILLVVPPDHPLVALPHVGASHLNGEPLVLTEPGCSYRVLFEQELIAAGVHPWTVLEFSNVEAIKHCVVAGMGIGVLPRFVVEHELSDGRLVALSWRGNALTMMTQIVWHRDKWISPALRAFLQTACEVCEVEEVAVREQAVGM